MSHILEIAIARNVVNNNNRRTVHSTSILSSNRLKHVYKTARESFTFPRKPVVSSKVQNDTQLFRRKTGCRRANLPFNNNRDAVAQSRLPFKNEIAQRGSAERSSEASEESWQKLPPGECLASEECINRAEKANFPSAYGYVVFNNNWQHEWAARLA